MTLVSTAAKGGGTITESSLSLSDVTTDDVTIARHGFAPKAPNDTSKFLRGDAAWAVPAAGFTVVTAAADSSVTSNTTPAVDAELFFTTVAGGQYYIELELIIGSPAGVGAGDFKATVGEDATTRGSFYGMGQSSADAVFSIGTGILASRSATLTFGTAATDRLIKMFGVFYGNGGTFALLWSQATSDANAVIRRAGSRIRYYRVV